MFAQISKLFALVLFLSFSVCYAERVGPSRLDCLQKRSPSPSLSNNNNNNNSVSKRFANSGSKLKDYNFVARDAKIGSKDPVLLGRSLADSTNTDRVEKRQTGIDPMFKLGDSNPEATTKQLNQVGDSAPLEGKANGSMAPFKKRSPALYPSNVADLNKRWPNPIAEPRYLNEISHLLATRGNADGSIEYF